MRRHGIRFRKDNVVMMTSVSIPMCLVFVASLGQRFNYCSSDGRRESLSFGIVFEKVKERVQSFMDMVKLTSERKKFEKKLVEGTFKNEAVPTKAQVFIEKQMKLARNFLSKNPEVKVLPADKGGRVVITDVLTYRRKMSAFIADNVDKGIYFHMEGMTLRYVKGICESAYANVRKLVNEFIELDNFTNPKRIWDKIIFEPFVMPRLYGLYKTHKTDAPIRPIISSPDGMGRSLERWMLNKLSVIAKCTGKYRVKNAEQLFERINGKTLRKGYVLVTWDFDNMFTNIPFQKTKDIILKYYHLIESETSMPANVFLNALEFLLERCPFFVYNGDVYLQTEGLSMGNSLSQVLAEITTNHLMDMALEGIDRCQIDFIYKYVDDIICGIKEDYVERVQRAIEGAHGMKLKLCKENGDGEVNYLQTKVKRGASRIISLHWSQKEYSAGCILDFHSFHPWNMKVNVVSEFVKSALRLSTRESWSKVTRNLRNVLKNSNYPARFINKAISNAIRSLSIVEQKDTELNKRSTRYIACPYLPGPMSFVKKSLKRLRDNETVLAPVMVTNDRKLIFSSMKDPQELFNIKNASFNVECRDCGLSARRYAANRDVESLVSERCRQCNSVNVDVDRRSVSVFKNRRDLGLSKNFVPMTICLPPP